VFEVFDRAVTESSIQDYRRWAVKALAAQGKEAEASSPLKNRHAGENEDFGVRARRETGLPTVASAKVGGKVVTFVEDLARFGPCSHSSPPSLARSNRTEFRSFGRFLRNEILECPQRSHDAERPFAARALFFNGPLDRRAALDACAMYSVAQDGGAYAATCKISRMIRG
jgi:hypothetical protein